MKSKTSFFNKVVFKKNITLYWPLVVCYLLYETVKVPGSLWLGIRQRSFMNDISCLSDCLDLDADFCAAAIMAILCGMLLFSYLFKAESANMIHALPVTRTELFFTNVLSGLAFLFVPQILIFLITILVSLVNGITAVQFIGIWLLSLMGLSFFLFSLVCFCVMFTGQLFALPVYFGVVNFLALGVSSGVRGVLYFLGYGISYRDMPEILFLRILSPLNYMCNNVRIQAVFEINTRGEYIASGIKYAGEKVVLGYLLAAIVFYLLAWYGYKKRKLESAGDLLTFKWIKPVFRWGVGSCFGYAVAVFAADFLNGVFIRISGFSFFALVILFSCIGFFIADMFVQKSFRVFTRKRFREYGLFFAFTVAGFCSLFASAHVLEQRMPDESQVAEAYIEMNYPVKFVGDDVKKVIEFQKELLGKKNIFRKVGDGNEYMTINFVYLLKNKKKIYRCYDVPVAQKESIALSEKLMVYEEKEESFMQYLVSSDYAAVTDVLEVNVEAADENAGYVCTLSGEQAKHLYEAVIRDAKAGVIQKYNIHSYIKDPDQEWQKEYPYTSMSIEFRHPDENWNSVYEQMYGSSSDEYAEDRKIGYTYINFGKDCTNIMQALVAEGAIPGSDEMKFRSE